MLSYPFILQQSYVKNKDKIQSFIQYKHVNHYYFNQKDDMADRKNKGKKGDEEARIQKQRTRAQQYKKRMMPLVLFLKKQGLRFQYARVGQNRIQYFRLDEFQKFKDSKCQIIEKNQEIANLLTEIKNNFLYFKRPDDMKNLKYPKQLEPTRQSQAKFCSFNFDTTVSRKWMMLGLLGSVLALVLFPVWPYLLKYGIWLISLYLLIFLVGLIVLRLVIYLICVIAGYNVWIFPNLLGEYGVIDSFKPIFYYQRWESSLFNIIFRVSCFILLVYCGVQIYLDPSIISDNMEVTKDTIDDIHDWGVKKISNEIQFSEKAITNLEDILNETADVSEDNSKKQQSL